MVPQLKPAGDGTGNPQWFVLRNRSIAYVYAKAGEKIKIDIRHIAGDRRPIALKYVVIDANHNELRSESIMPGDTEAFTCIAPETATYALVVTGGKDGQAWYGIRVHNQHMGILVAEPVYFFYISPFDIWVSRTHPTQSASIKIITGRTEVFTASSNNAEAIQTNSIVFDLPSNTETSVLSLGKPNEMPQGFTIQNLFVSVEGAVEPYLFDGPQRRLTTSLK